MARPTPRAPGGRPARARPGAGPGGGGGPAGAPPLWGPPRLVSLEANPLVVRDRGAVAVDALAEARAPA